LSNDGDHAIGT